MIAYISIIGNILIDFEDKPGLGTDQGTGFFAVGPKAYKLLSA